MTDGRIHTPEDEIDSLHVEIRQAKWRLNTLERAPREGRWNNTTIAYLDAVANQEQRIRVLEHSLAVERGKLREETEQSVSPSQPSQQSSRSPAPQQPLATRQTPTK